MLFLFSLFIAKLPAHRMHFVRVFGAVVFFIAVFLHYIRNSYSFCRSFLRSAVRIQYFLDEPISTRAWNPSEANSISCFPPPPPLKRSSAGWVNNLFNIIFIVYFLSELPRCATFLNSFICPLLSFSFLFSYSYRITVQYLNSKTNGSCHFR